MIEVSVVENEALAVDVAEQQSKEVMVSGEIIRLSKQLPKTEEGEDGLVLRSKDGQWATETVDDKPRENSKKLISSGAVFDEFKQRDKTYSEFEDTHKITTYSHFSQIDITVGSETIEDIMSKLPANSELVTAIVSANADIYPVLGGGTLVVKKSYSNGARFEFWNSQNSWVALHNAGVWSGWYCSHSEKNTLLWSGAELMDSDTVITLAENILRQPTGIALVFSRKENGVVVDYHFVTEVISKYEVVAHNGKGHGFSLFKHSPPFAAAGSKYLYIYNDRIVGNANNSLSGTGDCGIKYDNSLWYLRYVIGI